MRNIILSAVATMALSSFVVAGGDIVPVESVSENPVEIMGGFYIGAGYSDIDVTQTDAPFRTTTIDNNFDAVLLQAGYGFNKYIAIEGRAWIGLEKDIVSNCYAEINDDASLTAYGIYAKPMYPVTEEISVYGLLGYASVNYDLTSPIKDVDGFSWGLGLKYEIINNVEVFADYVSLYNDDANGNAIDDDNIYTYNFGLSYKFN